VRTPESPKSGFFTILSLRKPSWTTRGGLQAISGQNCKSQHHPRGDHKLVRYPVQVLVLLRNGLQAALMRIPIVLAQGMKRHQGISYSGTYTRSSVASPAALSPLPTASTSSGESAGRGRRTPAYSMMPCIASTSFVRAR
jgi:hypothetical protein